MVRSSLGSVVVSFLALLATFVVFLVETVLYYSFNAWYYRLGPAIVREQWQTTAGCDELRRAIRPLLNGAGLVGRESVHGFCLRQKVVDINTWPRIFFRIEDAAQGAMVTYEVRPNYSMALMLFPLGWLMLAVVGRLSWSLYISIAMVVIVFTAYKWLLPRDVRRIKRLRHIRNGLARFNLRVCEECGYDLFGHEVLTVCPECGWKAVRPADHPTQTDDASPHG